MRTLRLGTCLILCCIGVVFSRPAEAYGPNDFETIELLRESALKVRSERFDIGYVMRGAQRVRLLRLRMTSSCEDNVSVWSIRVNKVGMGDVQYIRGVYLLEGNTRLSRPVGFSSDGTAELRPTSLVIPHCGTRVVDIAVDFSRAVPVGSEYYLRISGAGDIISNANLLDAQFPLVNAQRTPVSPVDTGKVEVVFVDPGPIRTTRREILSKFRLKADDAYHYLIYEITLTNRGTARGSDLRDLYITRRNGRTLTPVIRQLDDDTVTLVFTRPYYLNKGREILFQLIGNAFSSEKTIDFTLEEESDLKVIPSRRSGRRVY